MEAYILFARGNGKEEAIRFEEQEEDIGCPSESSSSAARSTSTTSSSSDAVDLADDASSSGSTTSTSTCCHHFEMAALMTHIPIKRGLSKFFDGKSQSFASLAEVAGLEDLPKPPPTKRLKTSRSCCGGVGLEVEDDDARRGPLPSVTGNKKQASRARLTPSAARRLVRARPRPLVTARPAAAGKPLLFA